MDGLLLAASFALLVGGVHRKDVGGDVIRSIKWLFYGAALFGSILVWSSASNTLTAAAGRRWYSNPVIFAIYGLLAVAFAVTRRGGNETPRPWFERWGLTAAMGSTVLILGMFAVIAAIPVGDPGLTIGSLCKYQNVTDFTGWVPVGVLVAPILFLAVVFTVSPCPDHSPRCTARRKGDARPPTSPTRDLTCLGGEPVLRPSVD